MEPKYKALEAYSKLIKIFAVVLVLGTLIGVLGLLNSQVADGFTAFIYFAIGMISALGMLALSELLKLAIDIEHNTYIAAQNLEQSNKSSK
jgi:hypothetical protein